MKTSDLSHVTTASAVAHCIAKQPATPVVVHWQMQDFPIRVARALVEQQHSILWVVATAERAEIALQALTLAGIRVNPASSPLPEERLEQEKPLTKLQKVRRKLKEADAPKQFPPPGTGTVTVVSIQGLRHHTPLSEILRWASPLAVFDHVGPVNARWLTVDLDATNGDDETKPEDFIPARAENAHPIPVFREAGVPMVFLTRDEFEGALLQADFKRRACPVLVLKTRFVVPPKLKVSVVATDLVYAKYAPGAFLSILACHPDAQVVGEALIGATTPDRLSMSTATHLIKAVLKISPQQKKLGEAAERQTNLSPMVLRDMRIRDYVRTAVLAFDPSSRKPELVILCPWNMVTEVGGTLRVSSTARLSKWTPRATVFEGDELSEFASSVIEAAQSYLTKLDHGNRTARIGAAIRTVPKKYLSKRIFRFAISLHSATGIGSRLDLMGRAENFVSDSPQQNRAIGVFNKVFDIAYPWSPYAPGDKRAKLKGRLDVMRRYKEHWDKQDAKN